MAWPGTVGLVRLTVLNPIGRIMVLPTVAFLLFGAVMGFSGRFAAHVEWVVVFDTGRPCSWSYGGW